MKACRNREYNLINERQDIQTKLEVSNCRLEQFANSASHDFREPLRMVSSYLDLLAQRYKGKLEAKADTCIDYAHDGAMRMQAMIDSFLNLSRIHANCEPLKAVCLERLVKTVIISLQERIRDKRADIVVDSLPEEWAMKPR